MYLYLHNYSFAYSEWVVVLHGVHALLGGVFIDDGFGNLMRANLNPVCTFILHGGE